VKRKKRPSKKKKRKPKKQRPPPLDYRYITHHDKGKRWIRIESDKILYMLTEGIIDRMLHRGSHLHQKGVLVVFEDGGIGFGCTPLKKLFDKIRKLKNNKEAPNAGDIIPGRADFPAFYYTTNRSLVECERILSKNKDFVCTHQSVFINRNNCCITGDETTHIEMKDGTLLPVAKDKWKELYKGYPEV